MTRRYLVRAGRTVKLPDGTKYVPVRNKDPYVFQFPNHGKKNYIGFTINEQRDAMRHFMKGSLSIPNSRAEVDFVTE